MVPHELKISWGRDLHKNSITTCHAILCKPPPISLQCPVNLFLWTHYVRGFESCKKARLSLCELVFPHNIVLSNIRRPLVEGPPPDP